jgi:hypothetical protein
MSSFFIRIRVFGGRVEGEAGNLPATAGIRVASNAVLFGKVEITPK